MGGKEGGRSPVHGCQVDIQQFEQGAPGETYGGSRDRAGPHQVDGQFHVRPSGRSLNSPAGPTGFFEGGLSALGSS